MSASNTDQDRRNPVRKNEIMYKTDTDNVGYLYESQVIATVATRLTNDPNVKDFWLIANPSKISLFDDVIIKVDYKESSTSTPSSAIFLIQIKHTQKNITWDLKPLPGNHKSNSKFISIHFHTYKKSFDDICRMANDKTSDHCFHEIFHSVPITNYYFCFFTTAPCAEPSVEEVGLNIPNLSLLDITNTKKIKMFKKGTAEDCQEFLEKLFIFSDQPISSEMSRHLQETNLKGFSTSMVKSLCSNMADHLKLNNICNPLTKSVFTAKCAEVFLRQHVSQYMILSSPIRDDCVPLWYALNYQFLFIEAEHKKDILPLISNYYETSIRNLSAKFEDEDTQSIFKEFDWNACVRNCFQLSYIPRALQRLKINIANLVDLLLYMWENEDLPLIIDESIAKMSPTLSETKKRFIIISTEPFKISTNVFETAYDLKKHKEPFELVMGMELSLQGRPCVLGDIIKRNEELLKSITSSDILRWTGIDASNRQIGTPIANPVDHYIPRKFDNVKRNERLSEEGVLNIAKKEKKLTIISNDAGMGKSTVLQSLARQSSHRNFVILYNLANCRQELSSKDPTIHRDPVRFLYKQMETNRNRIIDSIFRQDLLDGNVTVFMDSFDEIMPLYDVGVLNIIAKILESKVSVFITSRTQAEDVVLKRFGDCSTLLRLTHLTSEEATEYCKQCDVPKKILTNIPDRILTVPLYLAMLRSMKDETIGNITQLYNYFFVRMMSTYYDKMRIQDAHVHNRLFPHQELIYQSHQYVALVHLFGMEKIKKLNIISTRLWTKILDEFKEFKLELGILFQIEPMIQFRHKTFAEYLTAKYITTTIRNNHDTKVLYIEVATRPEHKQIYIFLNEMRSEAFGKDSIQMAILMGDVRRVHEMCTADKACLDTKDNVWGMCPIHWASVKYFLHEDPTSFRILETIIQCGASVDLTDDILQWRCANFVTEQQLYSTDVSSRILLDLISRGLLDIIKAGVDCKTDLYNRIFEIKLNKFRTTSNIPDIQRQEYILMFHYYAALIYLFDKKTIIGHLRIITETKWNQLLSEFSELTLGFITQINPIQFKDDSYAKYLLAKYITKTINTKDTTKFLYKRMVTRPDCKQAYTFLNEMRSAKFSLGSIQTAILKCDVEKVSEIGNQYRLDAKDQVWGMHPVHWAAVNCFLREDEKSIEVLHTILRRSKKINVSSLKDGLLGWPWINFFYGRSYGTSQATIAYDSIPSIDNLQTQDWIREMLHLIRLRTIEYSRRHSATVDDRPL